MSHMTQDINQIWSLRTKWYIMKMIEQINSIISSWWTWILRALPFIPLRNAPPVLILIGGSLTEINDCADLWKYCWSKAHCFGAHWYGALCHRCQGISIHWKSFWPYHLQWQGRQKITFEVHHFKSSEQNVVVIIPHFDPRMSEFTWIKYKLTFTL